MPLGVAFCEALVVSGVGKTSVIEVGSKPAAGQERLANLRPIFKAARYVGTDLEGGLGVDVVCNGTRLRRHFNHHEFELGLSLDTLEHCWEPGVIVANLCWVAHQVALRVPFAAPIHGHPEDFWRVTPRTMGRWLKTKFEHGFVAQDPAIVAPAGTSTSADWPHGVYGFGTRDKTVRTAVQRHLPLAIRVLGYW